MLYAAITFESVIETVNYYLESNTNSLTQSRLLLTCLTFREIAVQNFKKNIYPPFITIHVICMEEVAWQIPAI